MLQPKTINICNNNTQQVITLQNQFRQSLILHANFIADQMKHEIIT